MKSSGIIFKARQFSGSDPGTLYEDESRNHRTCTPTALDYTELPSGLWVPTFDGSTSKVDTGSDWIGVQAITLSFWLNPISGGGENAGRVLDNKRFVIFTPIGGVQLRIMSDGATSVTLGNITVGQPNHVMITRTLAGTVNYYANGVLSGAADRASGTPEMGAANVIIGNRTTSDNAFDGYIDDLTVYSYIPAVPATFAVDRYNEGAGLYGKALI